MNKSIEDMSREIDKAFDKFCGEGSICIGCKYEDFEDAQMCCINFTIEYLNKKTIEGDTL